MFTWGNNIIVQLANGMMRGAAAVLSALTEIGNMIARRYLMGEGTERNPEKAKEYYIKGVLQNDEHAVRELEVLTKALRELKADAESQRIEMYCMRELAIRCGAKVLK